MSLILNPYDSPYLDHKSKTPTTSSLIAFLLTEGRNTVNQDADINKWLPDDPYSPVGVSFKDWAVDTLTMDERMDMWPVNVSQLGSGNIRVATAAQDPDNKKNRLPDRQIAILDGPGRPPNPGFLVEAKFVQIIVKGDVAHHNEPPMGATSDMLREYQRTHDKMYDIQDLLLASCPIQWVDMNTDPIEYWSGIIATSGLTWRGYDNQWCPMWTQQFRIVLEPQAEDSGRRISTRRDSLGGSSW